LPPPPPHPHSYQYDDIADIIIYKINNRGAPVVPLQYPLYKQCDPRWGNNTIVRWPAPTPLSLCVGVAMALLQRCCCGQGKPCRCSG
jgi:hypothetical protein